MTEPSSAPCVSLELLAYLKKLTETVKILEYQNKKNELRIKHLEGLMGYDASK